MKNTQSYLALHPDEIYQNNGYYWDVIDAETNKCYGIMTAPDDYDNKKEKQEFGFNGRIEKLTKEIVLRKVNYFEFKRFKKARRIWYILNMNCGKLKNPINKL